MNEKTVSFLKEEILKGLLTLPEDHVLFFKRLYSYEKLNRDISDVVDNLPEEKLDWALTQVENSILKINKKEKQADEH